MVVETKRTILRPYKEDDFEDYYAYILEEELQYMLGLNNVSDKESALQNFEWLLANREFFAIELKETKRVVGHVCLHPSFDGLRHMEGYRNKTGKSVSFAIAKFYRRRGIMREVLSAVIDQLRLEKNIDYLDLEYIPDNIGSAKLQECLGFKTVGTERLDSVELIVCALSFAD